MATWLVLHNKKSHYGDVVGEVYEYPIGIPNSKQIKIDDVIVFCLTKKSSSTNKRILGYGRVSELKPRPPLENNNRKKQRLAAYLANYREFDPALSFEDIGGDPRTNQTNSISRIDFDFDNFKSKPFDHIPNDDFVEKQQYARMLRRGQFQFREQLLQVYDFKCAISGHGPMNVLEACHILPHSKTGINQLENGLLLRSDLHNLFDDGYLRINPSTFKIEIHSELVNTPYFGFNGKILRSRIDGNQPCKKFLEKKYRS